MRIRLRRMAAGLVVMVFATDAHAIPIEYEFTATGFTGSTTPGFVGPNPVSGSFSFDADAVAVDTISLGTIYPAVSGLSGTAGSSAFSSSQGFVIVGNDTYQYPPVTGVSGLHDFFLIGWNAPSTVFSGFDYGGRTLVNVRLFWIEGQNGIGDFLDSQSLVTGLPPTGAGRLALDFAGGVSAFYSVSLQATAVPEPSSIVLLSLGLMGLCLAKQRKRT